MFISYSAAPQVTADFTTVSSNTGCGSLIVEFQDLSTGNPDTWLWDFGNGNTSTLQNPVAVYSSAGIYDVSLTVSDINTNDTKFISALIKVYPNPNVSISVLSSTTGCQPFNVNFIDTTNYVSPR